MWRVSSRLLPIPLAATWPGNNRSQAPVPARVSAGPSSPQLAITAGLHRGWRVSAPKLLLLLFACTATAAARCLTPRSSRAPTAGHAGPACGTRYILASRARASHRRCRLNSNVRSHKPPSTRSLRRNTRPAQSRDRPPPWLQQRAPEESALALRSCGPRRPGFCRS